jgi:hypothetical protein
MNIPNKITIGGQSIDIKIAHRCEDDKLGTCCVLSGDMVIANTVYGRQQSETSKINTFFHELTHAILDTMGERELSNNERFVCSFASFLTEAMLSAKNE